MSTIDKLPVKIENLGLVEDGAIIPAVRGTLTFTSGVHIHPSSDPAMPDYTIQSFTLKSEGGRVDGDIYDHPDISPWLGQDILFASHKSKNGRYGGVKVGRKSSGLFGKKPIVRLVVTKAGVLHTPETYAVGHKL